jgi:uncharacterized protein involved in tolerance to divalent cations
MSNRNISLLIIIGCGLFIIVFLGIFRPFEVEFRSIWSLIVYGFITITSCLFYYYLIPLLTNKESFILEDVCTKYLPLEFANIITIGIGNFLFAGYIEHTCTITWKWFWRYQFYTVSIGAILSVVLYWLVKSLKLKQQLKEVESINQTLQQQLVQVKVKETFVFESETRNEKLIIQSNDLICIKAEGNYSMFYYFEGDKTNSKLLRLSLKYAETIVEANASFSRSHRSYVVNCTKIIKINSIGSNYQLWVQGLQEPLPASRQNIADLKCNIEKTI